MINVKKVNKRSLCTILRREKLFMCKCNLRMDLWIITGDKERDKNSRETSVKITRDVKDVVRTARDVKAFTTIEITKGATPGWRHYEWNGNQDAGNTLGVRSSLVKKNFSSRSSY